MKVFGLTICWHRYEFFRKRRELYNSILLIFTRGPHFSDRYHEFKCAKCGKTKKEKVDWETYQHNLEKEVEYVVWK
jgi:hypothetical protein